MPYQSVEELLTCFAKTLSDRRFSSAESEVLTQLVAEARMTSSEIKKLRHGIFELVAEQFRISDSRELIGWLERASSALLLPEAARSETQVFFTPGDACEKGLCSALLEARNRVDICVFTITNDRLAASIKNCHDRGVAVRIITDDDKVADLGSDIGRLAACGIAIKQDSTPNHMHHKFAVIDARMVFTGSYNWTRSTQKNHENLIKTTEAAAVASFSWEFERLWRRMKRLQYSPATVSAT